MTSPFGLPFHCVEQIGLTFGFDSLPVTRITNWIISVETVCWKIDPVSGHSLCSWVVCITLICTRKNCFCLTASQGNFYFYLGVCLVRQSTKKETDQFKVTYRAESLSVEDINEAEKTIIQFEQRHHFK